MNMIKVSFLLLLSMLFSLSQGVVSAKTAGDTKWYYRDHQKIKRAVGVYLNQSMESKYDFKNTGKKGAKHFFSIIDIEGKWAMVAVTPHRWNPPENDIPDGAGFLLKKQRGQWKVLGMGTSLDGFGKKFGVPRRLWDEWDIA